MSRKKTADGRWIRVAYRAEDYSIPASELANLQGTGHSALEDLALHDGVYANYERIEQLEHDGIPFQRLRNLGKSWMIDVELSDRVPAHIIPLPPEAAWVFSRNIDLRQTPPVEFEGEPPAGVTGPAAIKSS